jgi:RNA polymerase sigma-70 factor (ECF subfamily)
MAAQAPSPPGTRPAEAEARVRDLYEAHGPTLLHAIAGWTGGDRHAAEDLLQETMLRAWRHLDSLGERPARPWLLTVARRLAIDAWRSRAARPSEVGDEDAAAAAGTVPDRTQAVLDRAVLVPALAGLSSLQRDVVLEVYFRGSTVRQTATALGIPEGTAKTRTRSALRDLRARLADDEPAPPAAVRSSAARSAQAVPPA